MQRSVALATAALALVGLQGVSTAAPAAAATTYTAAQANAMKFGYSTPTYNGRLGTAAAVDSQIAAYGAGVVRRYYSRFPAGWGTINSQHRGLPVAVSFKLTPQSVNSGQYDSSLTQWFKDAPTDRKTWWSYMPEPEDDIEQGQYTAAQFRAAYARIAGLSRRANNPRLISTLIIMGYTANSCGKGSGRNVMDYWPGSAAVDQIGFDCSNGGYKVGKYTDPALMFGPARDLARQLGKPWGLGEIESRLLPGDDGRNRAAWLMAVARYVAANGGTFACYFDESLNVDFQLRDAASKAAWRSVVIDQTP